MGTTMRWQIHIPEETNRKVRTYLARTGGKKGDLSKFVDEAVRGEVLRRTIREIQEQNTDLTEQQAAQLADEAVNWARADHA